MSADLQPIQLTEDQWQALRAKFAADGVNVPDEAAGTITKSGITASFTWNGLTLRVTVTDKPWVYPEKAVVEKLTEYIQSAIA